MTGVPSAGGKLSPRELRRERGRLGAREVRRERGRLGARDP